ncbi:MAG: hypothetical protein WC693_04595 [Patescibacteria group bacterium]|jgi:hypothetical protein
MKPAEISYEHHSSADKSFENLTSAEKYIFSVCGEIIAYKRGRVDNVKLLELRERATDLFTKMRAVNQAEQDDFKLVAEADVLRNEFQEAIDNERTNKYIDIKLDTSGDEDIANRLINELGDSENVEAFFEWFPPNPDDDPFGDVTGIIITRQESTEKFILSFNETFSHKRFASIAHIRAFYSTLDSKNAELKEHEHDGHNITELWLNMRDLSLNQVKEIIGSFMEIVKSNPRTPIEQ